MAVYSVVVSIYSKTKSVALCCHVYFANGQLKKNYEQRCHEVTMAEDALKKSVSLSSKDVEKVSSSIYK